MSEKKVSRGKKPSTNKAVVAISRAIAQSRKELGLTQRAAAEKVGLDYRHFQDVEKGKVDVRVSSLFDLQQQLGLKLEEHFCDKYGSPNCSATCGNPNYDRLWDIMFELSETGKVGLAIIKNGEVIFSNKYLRKHLSPKTNAQITAANLNEVTEPPLLGLSKILNLQEGHAGVPVPIILSADKNVPNHYLAFPKKCAGSISILFISVGYIQERLGESLTMLPLFNLMKPAK